jgi:hypothetical protein
MVTKVVRLTGREDARLLAKQVTELLGLPDAERNPEGFRTLLDQRAEEIFKDTRRSFRSLLIRSSVRLGPYQKLAADDNGARDTDTLYNSLQYSTSFDRRGGQLRAGIQIESTARSYGLLNQGYTAADSPNMSAVLSWAIRQLAGWQSVKHPGPSVSSEEFFRQLRAQKIGGIGVDYLFLRLYREISRRRYAGLALADNIAKFAQASLARRARGGFFSRQELLGAFRPSR